MNYMNSSPFRHGPMGMRNRRPAERPTFRGGPYPKDSPSPIYGPGKPFPKGQEIRYTPMIAQAYKPGYPTEMDYLSDPYREIDPGSLLFPDSPYDDAEEEDMYMDYSRGPLYFG